MAVRAQQFQTPARIWMVRAQVDLTMLEAAPVNLRRFAEGVVSETAELIQTEAQANLVRNGSFRSGDLFRSVKVIGRSPMSQAVEATMPYAGYVEYGTRFQRAKPWFTPAVEVGRRAFRTQMAELPKALVGRPTVARRMKLLIPRTSRGGTP